MNKLSIILSTIVLISSACSIDQTGQHMKLNEPMPPIALKKDSVLEAHGNVRIDPYFWMRLSDAQKTAAQLDEQTQQVVSYLDAENTYTDDLMKPSEKLQESLYNEMVGRIKKDDSSIPYFKNGYWYYTRYEGEKEYPIYCRKKESLEGSEQIILDANIRAKGHDYYYASGLTISKDNKILAFAEDTLSRRVYNYLFIDLETNEFLTDVIINAEPGAAWANDNRTFYYTSKNSITLLSESINRHQLGLSQENDELMYHEKDPSFYIGVTKSKSDDYLIIYCSSTLVTDYFILSSDDPKGTFNQFTPRIGPHEYAIEHYQNKFYILTNWDAPNFRLMETSEVRTAKEHWKEIIPNSRETLLTDLDVFKNHLVISERTNALTYLNIFNQKTGNQHYIQFEEPAYVVRAGFNTEFNTEKFRFEYSSLTTPRTTYEYDLDKQVKSILKQEEIIGGHDPKDYITERLFAEGEDGTMIPISLVYKKELIKNQNTPLLLVGYGSYGSSSDPYFSATRLSLLNRGFIVAIAHVRGGQEMGRQWYEDGKMFKKKNTFKDFISCTQYLSNIAYTSPKHLYAQGGSAGGLLMGAIANMSPESFNGIVAAVPFVDVISTMMDESIPLTTGEFDEWGNPKQLESYEYMLSYSPYDQVKAKNYPNMLVTTGYFDSQVQYWEPAKWVAKLRDLKTDDNMLLLHTNMSAGHGGSSGRYQRLKDTALQYAFFLSLEGINK
jgi:oligopeptidase B